MAQTGCWEQRFFPFTCDDSGGKLILALAQEEFQAKQMVVLSGTGAKEYYRSEFDYSPQADYMVKKLLTQ